MVILQIAAMAVKPGGPGCLTWFQLEDRMLILFTTIRGEFLLVNS